MSTWRRLPKWIVPAPVAVLTGWAAVASAGAPAPVAWTLTGLATWCATPFNWAFIIIGMGAGVGSFIGLRSWLEGKPFPPDATDEDMKAVLSKLAALEARLAADPNVAQAAARDFAVATEELARSQDPSERAAAAEIVGGNPVYAADRLIADQHDGRERSAERARLAARIYTPFAPSKAREAYEEAVQLDPDDVWSWIELGRLRRDYGTLADARSCFGAALQRITDERDRMVLHNEFGDLLIVEREYPEARREFEAGLDIAKRLATHNPGDSHCQRDLSVSLERLGDVDIAAGNLGAARERYEAGLAIRRRLSALEPGNSNLQRGLSVSLGRLGDVESTAGDLSAARERHETGLAIIEELAARDPSNSEWQRDLSVILNKLGDVEMTMANLGAARERYEAGLAIAERLAAREPDNSQWQRDLYVGQDRLARVATAGGNHEEGLLRFTKGERIMLALVERWPKHPGFAHDLANVREDIASLQSERA